ncbi:hypothetical protein WN982_37165 [Paraburkholderia sp. IMGN_8]|uniref:hypothetical protein n=1 Tax=Paraburkholderia sp. IMGN_8 TaxID=3136564 RepID=UPI0031019943
MRNIVLTGVLFFSLILGASAESINHEPDDLKSNVSLLTNQCGYVLGKNILSEISKSSSKINDQIISFDFYVSLKPADRPIHGKLSFGCFTVGSAAPKQGVAQRPTAAEEIAQADSGGRYARNVVWQRRYEGKGWSGTIAYVNSVFGDQENLNIPDYFLICPDKGGLACFSFEVVKAKLNKKESDRIPELLEGIGVGGF